MLLVRSTLNSLGNAPFCDAAVPAAGVAGAAVGAGFVVGVLSGFLSARLAPKVRSSAQQRIVVVRKTRGRYHLDMSSLPFDKDAGVPSPAAPVHLIDK